MSNIWIDQKYANQLQFRLERFKVKKQNPYVANFRCPLCGDSEKNKVKTRGYLLEHKGSIAFKCHNCQESMSLLRFLGVVAPNLQEELRLERLREQSTSQQTSSVRQTTYSTSTTRLTDTKGEVVRSSIKLSKLSTLPADHPAREYVAGRLIPTDQHHRIYFTEKFKAWVNTIVPGQFEDMRSDHARLVFPMKNRKGQVIGINARDMSPVSTLRYISIMFDKDHPKVFGLELADLNKDSFIVEGPIDSLFVDNSLAMAGAGISDLSSFMDPAHAIFVFDNEPRNKAILDQYRKVINSGHRIVIWPDHVKHKDINDMIQHGGMCKEEVSVMLHKNTYQGAVAQLHFNNWKKA